MKTVGVVAWQKLVIMKVDVIGAAMSDGAVKMDKLEMDAMAPLVGQTNMNVYWIQVKILFHILEQKRTEKL